MMENEKKTKKQLIEELNELRQCVAELKGFEKEIEQTRKFTKAFMQNSIPVAIMTSKEGRFVDVSDAFLRFTGRQRDEVIGRTSIECGIITAEQRGVFYDELNKKGRVEDLEMEVRTKDGALRYGLFNAVIMSLNNGKYVLTVSLDITDRKRAEDALRESKEKYRLIFQSEPNALFLTELGEKGTVIDANEASLRMYGYSLDEMRRMRIVEFSNEPEQTIRSAVLPIGDVFAIPLRWHRKKDGTIFPVEISGSVFEMNGRGVILAVHRDITDRKQAEEDLKKNREQYKSLYGFLRLMCDNVPDMIWAKDLSKRYLFVNKAICENLLCAKDTEEPIGRLDMYFAERERSAHPDQPDWHTFGEICADSDRVVMSSKRTERFDEFGNIKGQFLFLDVYKAPFYDEEGNMIGTVGCGRDITREKQLEQKQRVAEEKIHASLREKDILLNEIHHRVKNNMQVISSLLKLQASACKNPELTERLNESQSRIHAMALVHEKLYGSRDFTRIDLAGYVRTLSQELFQSHKINQWKIALVVQTDAEVYLDINKAIPCGLILNELISNALKHAFPGGRQGKLQILLRETENKEIEIIVRDNGLGLPDDVNIHAPRSLGLDLVSGLVKNQLDGQIEVRRDKGTEFRITFPL